MLRILVLLSLLVVLFDVSCGWGEECLEGPRGGAVSLAWVRTASGWERPEFWNQPPRWTPALHPFVVAAGQLLGSLMALVAFNMPAASTRHTLASQ